MVASAASAWMGWPVLCEFPVAWGGLGAPVRAERAGRREGREGGSVRADRADWAALGVRGEEEGTEGSVCEARNRGVVARDAGC